MWGIDPALEQFHARLADTIRHLGSVSPTTPLLGLASLAVLVIWRRVPVLHRVPGPLVVVSGATALAWWLGLDTPTLASRYGVIESAKPRPSLAFLDWSLAWVVLPSAFAVAALGGIETLLSAVVADDMTTTRRRHAATIQTASCSVRASRTSSVRSWVGCPRPPRLRGRRLAFARVVTRV
ncbi:MAG: SulP family inorganic anion transporter [Chloroflexi bacterium]|nr:MAG: SulP family inorganic anion transporter [Chloroflexota bacterium]